MLKGIHFCLILCILANVGEGGPLSAKKHKSRSLFASAKCISCKIGFSFISSFMSTDTAIDLVAKMATKICDLFHIEDHHICRGITVDFKQEFVYVLNEVYVKPSQACALLVEDCGEFRYPLYEWDVPLPDTPKPPVKPLVMPPKDSPVFRVLHLTDIHTDMKYKIGEEVKCGEPMCCRPNPDSHGPVKMPAPKWGTDQGQCDVPYWTVDRIFKYISENENIDWIVWTGDLPAHNDWNQTRSDQVFANTNLTSLFHQYFSNKLIASAIGNHESSPVDSFPMRGIVPDRLTNDWLYKELAKDWVQFLPSNAPSDQSEKIQEDIRNWMLLNQTDPDGVLQWLMAELDDAEKAGDKVHLIAHRPPTGGGRYYSWMQVYYKILLRYESTIAAHLCGHSHKDGFKLMYEDADPKKRATGVAFVAPSITTIDFHGPSYRIYTIDARPNGTYSVLDHETKFVNLTKANENPDVDPVPELEYTAREAYNLTSMFPAAMNELTDRMQHDMSVLQKYKLFYAVSGHYDCDDTDCLKNLICDIRNARPKSPQLCDGIVIPPQTHG